ncbi:imidazole glycerol phosphate synthase subunit HisH [Polynucleobacter paneuropaeus]|nr:imidazole glycerol phosphate synthase subunit HisH [Polynucleobacter paneuropaeus]
MIGVIDTGLGNVASVMNAFIHLDHPVYLCKSSDDIKNCDRLVLPGVGSFSAGMAALTKGNWVDSILAHVQKGLPLLGICLGMQLLFEMGHEHGSTDGLGLLAGDVNLLLPAAPAKVPHVGWNSLVSLKPHPLLRGIKSNIDFYFVHSYHCVPPDSSNVIAYCDFGGEFVAAVAKKNVAGMQFHPEKSQPAGMRILENFAQWDGSSC